MVESKQKVSHAPEAVPAPRPAALRLHGVRKSYGQVVAVVDPNPYSAGDIAPMPGGARRFRLCWRGHWIRCLEQGEGDPLLLIMGLGGSVNDFTATAYSEGITRVTESLMHRKNPVVTDEFPAVPYVENIGVRPDIVVDYMTKDNLLNQGASFVAAFTAAMERLYRQIGEYALLLALDDADSGLG